MHIEERLEFLDNLPSIKVNATSRIRSFSPKPPIDPNKESATVGPDMMNIYVPGVSAQNREDVDNCKLLMQNAASAQYDMKTELHQWYKVFSDGMKALGWTLNKFHDQSKVIQKTGLTMDAVAFDILQSLVGANATNLALLTGKAVAGVKNDAGLIEIYNKNASKGFEATFDMSPVWQTEHGSPMMILSCTSVDVRESDRGILWWKSTTKSTEVISQATPVYLNTMIYSKIRDKIIGKLGKYADDYLDSIPGFQ